MYRNVILYFCVVFVISKQYVIRLTQKLIQQGYHEDINLGELDAEAVVDNPAACQRLCQENPACHAVMLVGKLCQMFPNSHCLVSYHMQCLFINTR